MSQPPSPPASEDSTTALGQGLLQVVKTLFLLYVFLVGIHTVGEGFKLLSRDFVDGFFAATRNPFIGLMVGIVSTSIVQSSSVTTSLIVGLVAAPDYPLPLAHAIPMVMGANFGTTVTNTVVALAHIRDREEFHRAFSVSTCDDFFNFFAVLIILPIEIATGLLARTATSLAKFFHDRAGIDLHSPLEPLLHGATHAIQTLTSRVTNTTELQGILLILASGVLVFFALINLVRTLRKSAGSKVSKMITRALDQPALIAMGLGFIATAIVQSSSITTSLLVPLAGAGLITLTQAFPIVLGANAGTTVTALLAATAASGHHAGAGLAIALVHCLFNCCGIVLIYPWQRIRAIPLWCSHRLADIGVRSAPTAIAYVLLLFYGIPALFAALHHLGNEGILPESLPLQEARLPPFGFVVPEHS